MKQIRLLVLLALLLMTGTASATGLAEAEPVVIENKGLTVIRAEIAKHKDYKEWRATDWEQKTVQRHIHHKPDKALADLVPMYVKKIKWLDTTSIFSPEVDPNGKTDAQIIAEIGTVVADDLAFRKEKRARLLEKLACCLHEQDLRKTDLVARAVHHTSYYLDHGEATGTLTGTWTFTNGSTAVTSGAANGDADPEVDAGDYVQPGDDLDEWYEVASRTDDDNFVLAVAYKQATITDTINTTRINSNDGETTANAYCHLNQYTTDTVRTAGDVLYVRANTTMNLQSVDVTFDEDGTVDAFDYITGCDSVTNDPWSDASDIKPITDFNDTAFQIQTSYDNFWQLARLDIRQSTDTAGSLYVTTGTGWYILECDFSDNPTTELVNTSLAKATFVNCTFEVGTILLQCASSYVMFDNCTFDAGAAGSTSALKPYSSTLYCKDCSFGESNTFTVACIYREWAPGTVHMLNCSYDGTLVSGNDTGGIIRLEDADAVFEAHSEITRPGTITRATASPRSGGAGSYAVMATTAHCGPNYPLRLGDPLKGAWRFWKEAGSYTVTVYARTPAGALWGGNLGAGEFYITSSELDGAADATRLEATSAQTLVDNNTWTAFTTSITPAREGYVYIWAYVAEYDAGGLVHVDAKVTVE